jgi:hypothetical protein
VSGALSYIPLALFQWGIFQKGDAGHSGNSEKEIIKF